MKLTKQFLSLFLCVLLFVSNIYSQTERINKGSKPIYKDYHNYFGKEIVKKHLSKTFQEPFLDPTILVDSIIATQVDGSQIKNSYLYNSNNNISLVTSEILDNNQWINFSSETYIYDEGGNITLHLYENWYDNQWNNYLKETMTYDTGGRKTSDLGEEWVDNEWIKIYQDTIVYDDANGIFVSFIESWNEEETMYDTSRYTFHDYFNGSYSGLTEIWNNDTWVNSSLDTIYSDFDTVLIKTWMNDQWVNSYRVINSFNYDESYREELTEIWDENQWINEFRIIYNFDSENIYVISGLSEIWGNNEWRPVDIVFSFYTAENMYSCFGTNFNVYYNSLTAVSDKPAIVYNYSLYQNYPNPFNPSTIIKYSIPFVKRDLSRSNGSELKSALQVTLKVYNVLGQEVATLVNKQQNPGNYEVTFNANNLPSGVYFYRLKTENFSLTKKMLLLE